MATLTLQQIVDQASRLVGQTDPESLALAALSANQAYSQIYDAYTWRDSVTTLPLTTAPGVGTYGVNTAAIERVTAVSYAGNRLEGVTESFVFDTDPALLQTPTPTGIPRYWFENTAPGGALQIVLAPAPNAAQPLVLLGKQPITPLQNLTDTPQVRSISNALLEYVRSDMLRRQKHFTQAAEVRALADKLVQEAIALEQRDEVSARQLANFTVDGDTLAELVYSVCARTGDYSPTGQQFAREALRRWYRDLCDSGNWKEFQIQRPAVYVAWDRVRQGLVAPADMGSVQAVIDLYGRSLKPFDRDFLLRADGANMLGLFGAVPNQAAPYGFTIGETLAYPAILNRAQLTFTGSTTTDTTEIFVRGLSFDGSVDVERQERLVLQGTGPVTTANPYSLVYTLSRGASGADVTVTDLPVAPAVTNQTSIVLPAQNARPDGTGRTTQIWSHVALWPLGVPGTAYTLAGRRRLRPLWNDLDSPDIPGCGNYLVAAAAADIAARSKDTAGMVPALQAEAKNFRASLTSLEEVQQASVHRMLPAGEPLADFHVEDWGRSGGWDSGSGSGKSDW